ncbi:hypothetical protein DSO57_1003878 [Entomophthora muscae]|uniref:Uncharacterized protein n=1 Tax=Entomophthora muscae TaxID=34485 RepID=A0ACC2RN78_9FUNG|nr:hypothetical protein DSO57_1003878 [Entomophthora muscae]
MCRPCQAPNWPTSTGSLPVFAASAAIPEVSSCNPAASILTLQNKEDLSYFLFTATFYTKSRQAKATVLVDTGAAGNFMDLALAQSLGLSLLPPQSLIAASQVPVLSYPFTNPLSYCTGSHVFVSKFSAMEDLLYPVIVGMGWWRRHLVRLTASPTSFTSCWTGVLGHSPSFPRGGNCQSHAYLLQILQSLLPTPLPCWPYWLPSRTPLTLPFPAPSLHTLVTI